ncbi:MAG TPA: sensor histidine kinase [Candidatus Paceibacterota bacterium]
MKKTKIGGHLRDKILIMMFVVGIFPVVIAGFFALYSVTRAHNLNVASIEENLINQKTEEIRAFIGGIISILEIKTPFEQTGDIAYEDQIFILNGLLSERGAAEEASFINLSSGIETSRVGREHIRLDRVPELRDQSNLQKFLTAKEGSVYVGPVYSTEGGSRTSVAVPVRNKNDVVISVLSAEINLDQLQSIASATKLGNTGYLYIVDESGRIVASSLEKIAEIDLEKLPIIRALINGQSFLGYEDQERYQGIRGERVIAAARFMEDLNFGIVAEWPVSDADLVLESLRNQIIMFSILALIAILILSFILSKAIVRPVKKLEEGTKLVAQGKFDVSIDIKTGDELEDLGKSFSKMTEGLKQLQALKDEFVFIAAHELKTPVAAIKGYLSLITDGFAGEVNDKVKEFINKVNKSNARLITLVEDLLEVARSEAGRLQIAVQPVDIIEPIKDTLSELKSLSDEKSIEVVYNPPDATLKVMGDINRIKEVMVNLVGNAIKYTLGKGMITINHEVKDGKLVTRIKDTGLGMSKEAQAKLFQKFYRVQTKDTANISGTGLGLFIVKQIIEKMNGSIWVESEEGKGSTFSFSLQIAK